MKNAARSWRVCGGLGAWGLTLVAAVLGVVGVVSPAALAADPAGTPGEGELVGAGIARFHAKGVDAATFPPSMAILKPLEWAKTGEVPENFGARPVFWESGEGKDKRFNVRVDVGEGTSLYGTGEIAGPLLRNGRKTIGWNTDAYGYTEENASLYQTQPWVLAVRKDGTAFGVLADTTWRVEMDLTSSITFRGEGAPFRVWVIDRATPQEVVQGLGELVGTMPLPPLWAIGYHQCRYSYYPEARVREIADNFRERKIPCDVIWFDIDYMDQYKVFTFDKTHFPDVKKLNDDLAAKGFSRIWMIDPGIKDEVGYSVRDQLVNMKGYVTKPDGSMYRGEVWPGWCVFPDYTRKDVREWWQGLYKDFMGQGVSGVWNDMNEPAVFNVASKTMPEDNVHGGGEWDYGGTLPKGSHLQYHNVYGMLMAKGTFDGIQAALPEKRPFVLTRAGYIGSHRYAATWTGDNSAKWEDVEASVPMVLNMGLSGAPFTGPDIGGFNGNGDGAMFVRWMGVGSLFPFCRGHTGKGNIDKEPWAFGKDVEDACRMALERRYRLLPYYYTQFEEAHRTGLPVLRPVFFADPKDPALRSEDDAFMIGNDLLVVPKLTPQGDRTPVLPKGKWERVYLVGEGDHKELPALYIRAGSIVPIGPVMQHTGEKKLSPVTLLVALDDKGTATGTLYEDDGDGYAFEQGKFLRTTFTATKTETLVKFAIGKEEGRMPRQPRDFEVLLYAGGGVHRGNGPDGMALTFDLTRLAPVPAADQKLNPTR